MNILIRARAAERKVHKTNRQQSRRLDQAEMCPVAAVRLKLSKFTGAKTFHYLLADIQPCLITRGNAALLLVYIEHFASVGATLLKAL